jgi:hypothetical protein
VGDQQVDTKTDRTSSIITQNPSLIEEFQAVLFFRRPLATVVIFLVVNSQFWLISAFELTPYPLIILLTLNFLVINSVWSSIQAVLFPGETPKGSHDESNRVRDAREVEAIIGPVTNLFVFFGSALSSLSGSHSAAGLLTYAGVLFVAFVLTAFLNLFKLTIIAFNVILIVPGIWLHPQVVSLKSKIFNRSQPASSK